MIAWYQREASLRGRWRVSYGVVSIQRSAAFECPLCSCCGWRSTTAWPGARRPWAWVLGGLPADCWLLCNPPAAEGAVLRSTERTPGWPVEEKFHIPFCLKKARKLVWGEKRSSTAGVRSRGRVCGQDGWGEGRTQPCVLRTAGGRHHKKRGPFNAPQQLSSLWCREGGGREREPPWCCGPLPAGSTGPTSTPQQAGLPHCAARYPTVWLSLLSRLSHTACSPAIADGPALPCHTDISGFSRLDIRAIASSSLVQRSMLCPVLCHVADGVRTPPARLCLDAPVLQNQALLGLSGSLLGAA